MAFRPGQTARAIIPLLTMTLAAACAREAGPDATDAQPCDAITCSGHGTCQVTSDEPMCVCDTGYRPEGLECVSVSSPCDGVTCSGHGTCVVAGHDTPSCQCNAGYHVMGLTCVPNRPTMGNRVWPGPGQYHLGLNLAQVSHYMSAWMVNDMIKMAGWEGRIGDTSPSRMWHPVIQELSWDEQVALRPAIPTDALGWPTSMTLSGGQRATELRAPLFETRYFPEGTYTVLYEGEGTLEIRGATVSERSEGRIEVVPNDAYVNLSLTETDPNNTGNYLRNIRMIRPDGSPNNVFPRSYLEFLRPFGVIRMIHAWSEEVMYGPRFSWEERKTPSYSHWGGSMGLPYEIGIDLANQSVSDFWINVPVAADDAFIRQMARLTLQRLDPDRRLYVELSNELWNSSDPYESARQYGFAQAEAEWGDIVGEVRPWSNGEAVEGWQLLPSWQGMRSVQMCGIFREVWGEQSSRLSCVLAGQIGGSSWAQTQQLLSSPVYVGESGAPVAAPGQFVDAIAVAPYIEDFSAPPAPTPEDPSPFDNRFGRASWQALTWTKDDPNAEPNDPAEVALTLAELTSEHRQALDAFFDDAIAYVRGEGRYTERQPNDPPSKEPGLRYAIRSDRLLAASYGKPLIAYEGGQHFLSASGIPSEVAFYRDIVNRHPRMEELYQALFEVWEEEGGGLFVHFRGVEPRPTGWGRYQSEQFGIKTEQAQTRYDAPKYDAVLDEMEVIGQLRACGAGGACAEAWQTCDSSNNICIGQPSP